MPVSVPGAAVSPGSRSCSLLKRAALTEMDGLVLLVSAGWVTSEPVNVELPAVFKVTAKTFAPLTRDALPGKTALGSDEVRATVSLVLTTFQFESTALTVMLKGVPAV